MKALYFWILIRYLLIKLISVGFFSTTSSLLLSEFCRVLRKWNLILLSQAKSQCLSAYSGHSSNGGKPFIAAFQLTIVWSNKKIHLGFSSVVQHRVLLLKKNELSVKSLRFEATQLLWIRRFKIKIILVL